MFRLYESSVLANKWVGSSYINVHVHRAGFPVHDDPCYGGKLPPGTKHSQGISLHALAYSLHSGRDSLPGDQALRYIRMFAHKALHNEDTLHIRHYTMRTLCI